jgi:hypothetical protein
MESNQLEAESPMKEMTQTSVTHQLMKAMLEQQHALNLKFVGPDWPEQAMAKTKINYGSAILEEAQELQASDVSWKWWKSNPSAPDTSNMKIELVDLLHFAMSESIAEAFMDISGADEDAAENNQGETLGADHCMDMAIGDLAFALEEGFISAYCSEDITLRSESGYNAVMQRNALHALVASALQGTNTVSIGLESGETFNDGDEESMFGDEEGGGNAFTPISAINWTAFWSVAYHTGISMSDVYSTYMGKAALNAFRIAKGDKAGTYSRKWQDGLEDNHYLMEYFQAFFNENAVFPSSQQTANWLETAYAEFVAQSA